jgi:hypothetical protein
MRVLILIMLGKVLENIKTSAKGNLRYHRMKFNKPKFDECLKIRDQRNQAKLQ